MLKKITIILTLLITTSCQSKSGNPSTVFLYQNDLAKGTSLSEITKNYGSYSSSWKKDSSKTIYQYTYFVNKYDLISYLPIINHFGWINSKNYEVLLTIDDKEKLVESVKFYNQAKSKNSLVCNPLIYSCLRKVY